MPPIRARLSAGLVLATVLIAPLPGEASAQVVRGVVREDGSGDPIFGARLTLRDSGGEVRAGVISNEDGEFVLRAEHSGLLELEVSHIGYADWTTSPFALAADSRLDVEVRLDIEAIPLEPIVVVARSTRPTRRLVGFEGRQADRGRVGGFFISMEEVEARASATVTGLVRGTPGMTVGAIDRGGPDRSVLMANGCASRTFIDGLEVQQGRGHSVDDLLSPEVLAGVEIYPDPLGAPAQYADGIGSDCGVVLFWTRETDPSGRGWNRSRLVVGFSMLVGILTFGLAR